MSHEPASPHLLRNRLPTALLIAAFFIVAAPHSLGCSCSSRGHCETQCDEMECGDDGCGGVCGHCPEGYFCNEDFACEPVCEPNCRWKECGDDGCGGSCGECEEGMFCNDEFYCEPICVPNCTGRQCGDDGCAGSCGECEEDSFCDESFLCLPCTERCAEDCCSDDPCGNPCPETQEDGLVCDAVTCTYLLPLCAAHPPLPVCDNTTPAPTSGEETADWLRENTHPLECWEEGTRIYNFDIVLRDFGDEVVFMFGEVHGTIELGRVSAALFEHLARSGWINSLTMEIGMDLTEPMRTYVETGAGPLITEYDYNEYSRDMFLVTLLESARELYLEGIELNIYGSDIPMRLEWVNEELTALASNVSAETSGLILDTLPSVPTSYSLLPLSYFNGVNSYYHHIQNHHATICLELSTDDCDYIQALVAGLWSSAFVMSEKMFTATSAEWDLFFQRREPVIYYNFYSQIGSSEDRTYSHYGAAHTALDPEIVWGEPSVAYSLYSSHPPTMGSVYTTTPAFGPGSRIRYGGYVYDIDAEPVDLASAMSGAEHSAYWLSTRHPSLSCQENPLSDYVSQENEGLVCSSRCDESYAAFTYIPRLTPERVGRSKREPGMAHRIMQYREVIAAKEMDLLLKRR